MSEVSETVVSETFTFDFAIYVSTNHVAGGVAVVTLVPQERTRLLPSAHCACADPSGDGDSCLASGSTAHAPSLDSGEGNEPKITSANSPSLLSIL